MRITVFGANGKTGRELVRQALDAGHAIVAFTRRPADFPLHHGRLRVVAGDIADPEAVATAIAGSEAVLSSVGVPFAKTSITVYSTAARTIIDGMRAGGVRRLAVVSSSAVETHQRTEGWLFEAVLQPYIVNGIGKTTYDDMRIMEAIVRESGLDWTIVRPSGLFSGPGVTHYRIADQHMKGRFTSRADLADFLLRQASDRTWIGKLPEVHTDDGTPSLVQVIWSEGIRGGK